MVQVHMCNAVYAHAELSPGNDVSGGGGGIESIWPNMGCLASLVWTQMLIFLIRNVYLRAVASQV